MPDLIDQGLQLTDCGGFVMMPVAAPSVVSLALVVEGAWPGRAPGHLESFIAAAQEGQERRERAGRPAGRAKPGQDGGKPRRHEPVAAGATRERTDS